MSKTYQNVGEIYKALVEGKKIHRNDNSLVNGRLTKYVELNSYGDLVNDKGLKRDLTFQVPSQWQEYTEPVTLEMAIAHYKATGKPFMRRAHSEDSWGVGGFVFHEEDITATDYVLLYK